MTLELVTKIKKAENAAAERISNAKAEAKRVIDASEKDAQVRAAAILAAEEKSGAALLEDVRHRALAQCEGIAADAKAEADALARKASEKLPSAVKIIMSKVVE